MIFLDIHHRGQRVGTFCGLYGPLGGYRKGDLSTWPSGPKALPHCVLWRRSQHCAWELYPAFNQYSVCVAMCGVGTGRGDL